MPRMTATDVVTRHIVTNTVPIFSRLFWLPIVLVILYTIKPISKKKIGRRTHKLRRVSGILLFFETLLTQKSTRLPLGQRFPQNHLPLNGLLRKIAAKTRSIKYPSSGYQSPPMDTIRTKIPK
jgi:hypothetical protein